MLPILAYYDPEGPGFYQTDYNSPESIPASAILLEGGPAERQYLVDGLSEGKEIRIDENGVPRLVEPTPPTDAEIEDRARQDAWLLIDTRLRQATLRIDPLQDAVDLDEATADEVLQLSAWKRYRVQLNRVPTQSGYPFLIDWPVAPE